MEIVFAAVVVAHVVASVFLTHVARSALRDLIDLLK